MEETHRGIRLRPQFREVRHALHCLLLLCTSSDPRTMRQCLLSDPCTFVLDDPGRWLSPPEFAVCTNMYTIGVPLLPRPAVPRAAGSLPAATRTRTQIPPSGLTAATDPTGRSSSTTSLLPGATSRSENRAVAPPVPPWCTPGHRPRAPCLTLSQARAVLAPPLSTRVSHATLAKPWRIWLMPLSSETPIRPAIPLLGAL